MADGTASNPEPVNTSKIEPKVKWASIASYLAGVLLLALVNALTGNGNELIMEALPDWLEAFILPLVPAITALVAGYSARHQYRSAEVTGGDTLGGSRSGF